MGQSGLYLVEADLLPEVFLKVCEAKEHLQTGAARTVAEAVEMADALLMWWEQSERQAALEENLTRTDALSFLVSLTRTRPLSRRLPFPP